METSHWSRSVEILCSDWLPRQLPPRHSSRHPKLPTSGIFYLSLCLYDGFKDGYNDPTRNILFLCLPNYHSVLMSISNLGSSSTLNSGYGTRNSDYEVFGKTVICPMYGRVVTVERDVSWRFIHYGHASSIIRAFLAFYCVFMA